MDAWALYDNAGVMPVLIDWREKAGTKILSIKPKTVTCDSPSKQWNVPPSVPTIWRNRPAPPLSLAEMVSSNI